MKLIPTVRLITPVMTTLLASIMGAVGTAHAASLIGLGDLPGGSVFSQASAISSDGSTVVGDSISASGSEAFRWTAGGGMVGLGDLPGTTFASFVYGVSSDGSAIAGRGNSAVNTRAIRWNAADGMVDLGVLSGGA
ncbi:MAG: hypothetical protein KDA37_09840, partial [Planctomycetales bacterium]|nr:hypothetical protein [Planctomycetales bacterium]